MKETNLKRSSNENFDVWEQAYSEGFVQRYPWDTVVSFIYRYSPKDQDDSSIQVMEVGFGTAPNLWFAAREGFSVKGIEASPSAVEFARARFEREGLIGDLRTGDFRELPFADNSLDLVIDRCSLCCVGLSQNKIAVQEIHRCLRKGGRFLHVAYTDQHSSCASGRPSADGLTQNITEGALVGAGELCFSSRSHLVDRFSDGWRFLQFDRAEATDLLNQSTGLHSQWVVVAEKI